MAKVTTKDIAKQVGVSQTTVSFVLNNKPGKSISLETRQKILEAAHSMGYSMPARASKKRPVTLGLLVPTLTNLYYPFLVQQVEIEANKRGIKVIIMDILRNNDNEPQYFDYIKNGLVDGILALYTPSNPIPEGLPLVIVSEYDPKVSADTVSLNSRMGGQIMADHLLELGHQHIAYISSPFSGITSARMLRLDGIKDRLKEAGLENNLTVYASTNEQESANSPDPYEYVCGYELTKKLLKDKYRRTTAIIAVNDTTAAGCIAALREANVRIPDDMAVCGFDNLLIGRMFTPQLTSVDQMAMHACHIALTMLLEKIQDPTRNTQSISIEYKPHLIVRGSTKKGEK